MADSVEVSKSGVDSKDLGFQPFPRLPAELRLKIFRLALCLPGNQIVEIFRDDVRGFTMQRQPSHPLLRTNSECREEVLPYFGSLFHQSEVLMRFDMDTLYISEKEKNEHPTSRPRYLTEIIDGMTPEALSSIRHIALTVGVLAGLSTVFSFFNKWCGSERIAVTEVAHFCSGESLQNMKRFLAPLLQFRNLEIITIVLNRMCLGSNASKFKHRYNDVAGNRFSLSSSEEVIGEVAAPAADGAPKVWTFVIGKCIRELYCGGPGTQVEDRNVPNIQVKIERQT